MEQENITKLKKLIDLFEHNLKQYKGKHYDEAKARADFIDKFFELLGWDVYNKNGYSEQYRDVVREDRVEIKGKVKAPDYCFRIGGVRKFFVEAKKPSIDIKHDIEPAFQLRRYAYTARLPLSILTDFEEFAVYDTRIKPDKRDQASTARIFYSTYEEYEKEFDFISRTFSREAILKGSFDQYVEDTKRKRGTSEVDKEFLKLIEKWRENLAKNIALRNKKLSIYELNYAVQKIIDRIIFLRITEDRHIEDYGRIQKLNESKNPIYPELVKLFLQADVKYDSGLFDFQADRVTPGLKIDDRILKDIFKSLYYPDSPYEFSVFDVEILGNIYEQFLGKTIRLTAGHQAKVEDKPEVKKAGGVYYTPKYIVEYIVKNTVGEKIKNKTPDQISKLKICDPACGSGSFLLGAYQMLVDYHLKYYTIEKNLKKALKENKIYQLKEKEFRLTIEEKHGILLNNIFGVDIDSQAVEVTKLSLLLKLMEGESQESTGLLFKFSDIKLLPDLSDNIKCGNSLIGSDFYDTGQMNLFQDEETTRRINVFDWPKEFPDIFTHGGFDIIIGNPPYIRIHRISHEESDYFFSHYKTPMSKMDISLLFFERSLGITSREGIISFISTSQWLSTEYGKKMRLLLSDGKLYKIIDFGSLPVFQKSDTYPAIFILSPKKSKLLKLTKINCTSQLNLKGIENAKSININVSSLSDESWNLGNIDIISILKNRNLNFYEIKSYGKAYIGTLTGMDIAFVVSQKQALCLNLEGELLIPYAYRGNEIYRYNIVKPKARIIYPYFEGTNGKPELIPEKVLKKNYPNIYKYLFDNKEKLRTRMDSRKFYAKGTNWYRCLRPGSFNYFHPKKLIVKGIDKRMKVGLLGEDTFFNGANCPGIIFSDFNNHNLKYFIGLLNSKVLSYFLKIICPPKLSGYIRFNASNLNKLPIRNIDFKINIEKTKHNKIAKIVDQMLEIQKKYHNAKTESEKKMFKKQIDILDHQIDQLVYELYGLTEEEIVIVEENVKR